MKAYRKWVLSLGIAAVTPGIALAGPFDLFRSNRSAPKAASASENQKIAEQVAKNLRAAKLKGFDIEIEVRGGVCRLMGRIVDASQKRKATAAAEKVKGVRRVDNQLQIIKGRPAAAPAATARRPSPGVQPATPPDFRPEPKVNLAGFVDRQPAAKAETEPAPLPLPPSSAAPAQAAPKSQPKESRATQKAIANRIASAIGASGIRGHDISLTYKHGVAKLAGRVQSPQDVAMLTRVVSSVPGVRQVDNQLSAPGMPAGSGNPRSHNQMMAEQIARALGQGGLGSQDIEVRFNSGVATLSGRVADPRMAMFAHHTVAQVPGVQQVDNRLMVPGPPPGQGGMPPGAMGPGGPVQQVSFQQPPQVPGAPPVMTPPLPSPPMAHGGRGPSHLAYDLPNLPNYAWPSYASYPNYASLSYPKQYSASAWPYIGPFYPYPQVPLGWRSVQLQWDDGYWSLNFNPRTEKWFWFLDPKNW